MSWFVSLPEPLGDAAAVRLASRSGELTLMPGLGSARASARWSWADSGASRVGSGGANRLALRPVGALPRAARDEMEASVVRIPAEIVRAMALAARNSGRSERELWAEAAREWLNSRSHGDEPPPATPSALPVASPARSWDEIDGLMAQLRLPVGSSGDSAA